MREGLHAWQQAGYPTVPVGTDGDSTTDLRTGDAAGPSFQPVPSTTSPGESVAPLTPAHAHTFLPGLVENYLSQQDLPTKKELTVLFVDIADSTATVLHQPPEMTLALVQRFMGLVTEIALAYCGDVKDYEGDGALLYFESVAEATQAALAIRSKLAAERPEGQESLQARLSLNVGSVVIGVIGSSLRRSVALIGPSINLASRILKQIPPGGIIATEAVVERLHQEAPVLAQQFQLWNKRLELKGFHKERVTAFHIP